MLTNRKRAMTISSSKNFVRARVDSIKGQYGFISYETDESKKLFFHMSEVEGNTAVEPGKWEIWKIMYFCSFPSCEVGKTLTNDVKYIENVNLKMFPLFFFTQVMRWNL